MIGFPADSSVPHPDAKRRRGTPVFGTRGIAAGQHPLVASTGASILAEGGNAIDAAIAAAWTASVVMPESCGLGGDLFAIVHQPGSPITTVLSSGIAPRNASLEFMQEHAEENGRVLQQTGPLSPSVPGFVAGISELQRRYASKPVDTLTRAAIGYAAQGFPVTHHYVRASTLANQVLAANPVSARTFLKNGSPYDVGEILRQPALAKAIQRLTEEGFDDFYQGSIASSLTKSLSGLGGKLDRDDFADHSASVEPPILIPYRDHTIWETGWPTPGMVLLEALNIVENAELRDMGISSAPGVHIAVEALKLAFADRRSNVADPAFVDLPMDQLLAKELAKERYDRIDPNQAMEFAEAEPLSSGDTTYLCTADGRGMMVSLIISISGAFGSGVTCEETGILFNNRAGHCFSLEEGHPNMYAPGKKTTHTLNCYMIGDSTGTPLLVGGTPGGDSQPQWNIQSITGLIDAQLDVQAATEVPRWTIFPATYPIDQGNPYQLRIEQQIGDETISGLETRGHDLKVQEPWAQGGSVQLISRDPETGVLVGGSDPRADGLAIAL